MKKEICSYSCFVQKNKRHIPSGSDALVFSNKVCGRGGGSEVCGGGKTAALVAETARRFLSNQHRSKVPSCSCYQQRKKDCEYWVEAEGGGAYHD